MKLEVRFLKQKKDEKKEVEKSVPETASQETRIEDTSKTEEIKPETGNDKNGSSDSANIWKEVKRRSKNTSKPSSKEDTPKPTGPETKSTQDASEKEELDFQFDEELDVPTTGRMNNFTEHFSEDESDYELSDRDINKILIVTQVGQRLPKHEGYDRTGNYTSRTKITQDLEQVINDGLFNYEEDLWTTIDRPANYKTVNVISQEDFEKMVPKSVKKPPQEVPPPPPPTYVEDALNTSASSQHRRARFFAAPSEHLIDPRTPRKRKTKQMSNAG